MAVQVTFGGECLSAYLTLVGFLTSVDSVVGGQMGLLTEGLTTLVADIGSFT